MKISAVLLSVLFYTNLACSLKASTAERMLHVFVEECIIPLAEEDAISGIGMEQLPDKTAKLLSKHSTGRGWVAKDAHVTLTELSKNGLAGCAVEFQYQKNSGRSIDEAKVFEGFERWVNEMVASGRYRIVQRCQEENGNYNFLVESAFERSTMIRAFIHFRNTIPLLFAVAAESPDNPSAEPC